MRTLFRNSQRQVLWIGLFASAAFSVYFYFFNTTIPDYFPVRIALTIYLVIVISLDYFWVRFRAAIGAVFFGFALIALIPAFYNPAVNGITYFSTYFSVFTCLILSLFFRQVSHYLVYFLIYSAASILILKSAPSNEMGVDKYLFTFITTGILQMVVICYLIYIRNKMEAKSLTMENVLGSVPELVWSVDRHYRILVISSSMQDFFKNNFGKKISIGQMIFDGFPEEIRGRWEPRYQKVFEGEKEEVEYETPGEPKESYLISMTPNRGTDGEIAAVTCIGRNVTRERTQMELLKKLSREAQQDLELEQERIRKAQATLFHLIPSQLPISQKVSLSAVYIPSQELSGDFLGALRSGTRTVLILADCCGHGIEASLNAVLLWSICDKHLPRFLESRSPGDFLSSVNRDMTDFTVEGKFHSLFAAVFDEATGELVYAGTGTKAPALIRVRNVVMLPESRGMLLGFDSGSRYQEVRETLRFGDRAFFYSDALVEVFDENKDHLIFKERDLVSYLDKNQALAGEDLLNDLLKSLTLLKAGHSLQDDLSVICFGYSDAVTGKIQGSELLYLIREGKERIFSPMGLRDWTAEEVEEFSIAYLEIVLNALVHGNKNDPAKNVRVSFELDAESIRVLVQDEGEGFDQTLVPDPVELARRVSQGNGEGLENLFHGRGIWMSRSIFLDSLTYNQKGNEAILYKKKRPRKTRMSN